jgi:chromosomal replication initiator protein
MVDTKQLWENCLAEIETNVSKANFSTWFKNTAIVREEQGTIYVGVPNEFVKDWLANKYQKLILKTLTSFSEYVRGVSFVISKHNQKNSGEHGFESKILMHRELPLQDLYINKEDNLNPRYTFENFIVGPFNELAYAAGQGIILKPGTQYNPFFIYGPTGLGKTHLIQSIGNSIKQKYIEKKVHYVTLEKFAIDYINAVQSNKPNSFKEKYRKYDVLIIDDIQFISNKEKTQEELFHLFNALYEQNKQIIFSSDKHPNYIQNLEDRLKSRFSSGMIVDVIEPDFESRLAIIKAKIQEQNLPITSEVLEYIAGSIQGNIRELEGSLNAIIAATSLKNRELSLTEVKNLIKNNIRPKKNVSVAEVVKAIADFYNLEDKTIYEKTRRKEIVHARQIAMYILREEFNVSYPLIGQKLGGKDHTTVIHSCLKVKNDCKNDPTVAEELERIKVLFK